MTKIDKVLALHWITGTFLAAATVLMVETQIAYEEHIQKAATATTFFLALLWWVALLYAIEATIRWWRRL